MFEKSPKKDMHGQHLKKTLHGKISSTASKLFGSLEGESPPGIFESPKY